MAEPAKPLPDRMTVPEFLAWDDGTDTRYELIDGQIVAMAPPSPSHSTITGNMAGVLYGRLRPPCRVRVEYGIGLPSDDDRYYQADIAVVCGDLRRGGEPLPDPVLIVEVLSQSTASHDRGRKAHDYRAFFPGLQIILLVSSDRRWIERWARDGERWIVTDHIGERGTVTLDVLGTELDLAEVYAGLEM